jgi:hypothetical protein
MNLNLAAACRRWSCDGVLTLAEAIPLALGAGAAGQAPRRPMAADGATARRRLRRLCPKGPKSHPTSTIAFITALSSHNSSGVSSSQPHHCSSHQLLSHFSASSFRQWPACAFVIQPVLPLFLSILTTTKPPFKNCSTRSSAHPRFLHLSRISRLAILPAPSKLLSQSFPYLALGLRMAIK